MKAYWRQQVGYGEGEAWLDAHHPEKFVGGTMLWRGRIYSPLPFVRVALGDGASTPACGARRRFPSRLQHRRPSLAVPAAFRGVDGGVVDAARRRRRAGLLTAVPVRGVPLLVAGAAGWATTLARCVDVRPAVGPRGTASHRAASPSQSRFVYRAVIAWLHLVQPVARCTAGCAACGRPPTPCRAGARDAACRGRRPCPSLARRPPVGSAARRRLVEQRTFWSESWVAHSALLTELAGVLRASRPAQVVEVGRRLARRSGSERRGRALGLAPPARARRRTRGGPCLLRVGTRLRLPARRGLAALALGRSCRWRASRAIATMRLAGR